MMLTLTVIEIVIFTLLLAVSGIVPKATQLSRYELKRRKDSGDRAAEAALEREALLVDIISLQRVLSALLLVIFVILSVVTFGWFIGIVISVIVSLEYGRLARVGLWQRRAQKLYETHEQAILRFVQKIAGILRFMRSVTPEENDTVRLSSRAELHHLVNTSGQLLTADEKKLIEHGLTFNDRQVKDVMTPRGVIDSIGEKELLGPLVLDDLHKTGHSRFPVVEGDIDHIVGILYIHNLLTLDVKRSVTAGKAMEPRVFYIHEDQTLQHALAAFLRTHHHLFVVVNEFRETVGLLSLEDVIESLLGRKIVDEFDTHEDLRVVAARNPRDNNHPKKHKDV